MPRDISGNYTLPLGNPVVNGTIIDVNWANPTMADIATQLNNVVTRDGLLFPTSPMAFADGSAAVPSITFSSDPDTGFYRVGANTLGVTSAGLLRLSVNGTGNWVYVAPSVGTGYTFNGLAGAARLAVWNGSYSEYQLATVTYGYIGDRTGVLGSGAGLAIRAEGQLDLAAGGATSRLNISSAGIVSISTAGESLVQSVANAGGQNKWRIENTSSSADSDAVLQLKIADFNTGNPYIIYTTGNGEGSWSTGRNTGTANYEISEGEWLGGLFGSTTWMKVWEGGRVSFAGLHDNVDPVDDLTDQFLASGGPATYTPSVVNASNAINITVRGGSYHRVGNRVEVDVVFEAQSSAVANTSVDISLPIASNFTSAYQGIGVGGTVNGTDVISVLSSAANDNVRASWAGINTGILVRTVKFSYEIL